MKVVISKPPELSGGSSWLKKLYDLFAPVREDMQQYPEEEINQAIFQALSAVRQGKAGQGVKAGDPEQ